MKIYNYQEAQKPQKSIKKPRRLNWRKINLIAFRLFATGFLLISLMFLYYGKDLPNPNKLLDRSVPESTKIFARDGSLLYEVHGEIKRTLINFDQIPDNVKHATISIEDKDFYNHAGISITGIIRSAIVDILSGKKAQGASTITQQFVKNAILTQQKSWDRKIRELILAIIIDARFSKNDILKLYLNEIPYGRNAYGIEAAAQSYFGKSAKDLSLAESAYLSAIPQAPTYYNPLGTHRQALDARKNLVLQSMKNQGYINEEQRLSASEEKVNFISTTNNIKAPNFVFYIQDYLTSKYGETTLEQGGLKVYTTLDPKLQDIAEQAVKEGAEQNTKKYNANNAALVAVDPKTGQILAMVGSKDYFGESQPKGCIPGKNCNFEPNFNVAISDSRQPGSSFKPYVYVTAFKKESGYSPASLLVDVVTDFGLYGDKNYVPHNYSGEENGPVSMRKALAGSLNIPAVKTLDLIGVNNAVQTAHDLGITSSLSNCGLSLVLGGCSVKLIDHVSAYSVFANSGIKNEKTAILKVVDQSGKTLEEYSPHPTQVLDPQAVYELTSIMTDNDARSYIFGSNSPLILSDRTVAAKTGTTNDWTDGWTIGFTPSLAAGVWAGNNCGNKCPMKKGADGVLVAAPIWHNFMQKALKGTPAEDFPVPDGIQKIKVDEISGKLPTNQTPSVKEEVFASYSVPSKYDDVHIQIPFDSQTQEPANQLTPPDRITYKTYNVLHSERPNDPNWENPVIAWATAHGYTYPPNSTTYIPQINGNGPSVSIIQPNDGDAINSLPTTVIVSASSDTKISRVDLSIDGQFYQSLSSAPFEFKIYNNLGSGSHTIAAKAVDISGASSDTSTSVIFDIGGSPLRLISPIENESLTFPNLIIAEYPLQLESVNFFYQRDNLSPQIINGVPNTSHPGNNFQYSVEWKTPPESGNYTIYAQAKNGKKSQKVKINIP